MECSLVSLCGITLLWSLSSYNYGDTRSIKWSDAQTESPSWRHQSLSSLSLFLSLSLTLLFTLYSIYIYIPIRLCVPLWCVVRYIWLFSMLIIMDVCDLFIQIGHCTVSIVQGLSHGCPCTAIYSPYINEYICIVCQIFSYILATWNIVSLSINAMLHFILCHYPLFTLYRVLCQWITDLSVRAKLHLTGQMVRSDRQDRHAFWSTLHLLNGKYLFCMSLVIGEPNACEIHIVGQAYAAYKMWQTHWWIYVYITACWPRHIDVVFISKWWKNMWKTIAYMEPWTNHLNFITKANKKIFHESSTTHNMRSPRVMRLSQCHCSILTMAMTMNFHCSNSKWMIKHTNTILQENMENRHTAQDIYNVVNVVSPPLTDIDKNLFMDLISIQYLYL